MPVPTKTRDQVSDIRDRAETELAVTAYADIVFDQHGTSDQRRQAWAEREISDIHVCAEKDHARFGVERPRRTDSRRRDVLSTEPRRSERVIDAIDDRAENRIAPFHRGRGAFRLAENLVVRAHDPGEDFRPAQVDPQNRRPIALNCHYRNLHGRATPAHQRAEFHHVLDLNRSRPARADVRPAFSNTPARVTHRAFPLRPQIRHEPLTTRDQLRLDVQKRPSSSAQWRVRSGSLRCWRVNQGPAAHPDFPPVPFAESPTPKTRNAHPS